MICFSAFPGVRCHFCKSGKRKCQYSAKPPKEGKVAVKVKKSVKVEKSRPKEKVKGKTKRMGLREVRKPAPKARHDPAVVAGPSRFPGLMSTNVPVVQAKLLEKVGYWVGTNLVGEPSLLDFLLPRAEPPGQVIDTVLNALQALRQN
jgi:hypothetical protein